MNKMEANNLRIGNLLNRKGVVVTIDGRTLFDFAYNEKIRGEYNPIKLTEEWLIRFGFEKIICDEHPFIHFIIKGIFRIDFHPNNGFEFNCYGHPYDQYVEENFFSFKALHIHQLQNLFYALTGEELKITL